MVEKGRKHPHSPFFSFIIRNCGSVFAVVSCARAACYLSLGINILSALALPSSYTIANLGTLGGDSSRALGLNESGQVVGSSRNAAGAERAFLWTAGLMTDLAALGGTNSAAASINGSSQIVGWAETPDGRKRACLFEANGNIDLSGALPKNSYAASINDNGDVTGWAEMAGEEFSHHAYLFRPNLRDLGLFGGQRSQALAINNNQQIAGWTRDTFWTWSPHDRPAWWAGVAPGEIPLGLAGIDAYVLGINEAGQMVGMSGSDYFTARATIWFAGTTLNLGSLSGGWSSASDINNKGVVVGSSDFNRPRVPTNAPTLQPSEYEPVRHAFVWHNGLLADLNELLPPNSGWELIDATVVNDSGQIVGRGLFDGRERAFLLTPATSGTPMPFVELSSPVQNEFVHGSNVTFRAEVSGAGTASGVVEFFAWPVRKRDMQTFFINSPPLIPIIPGATQAPGYLGSVSNAPYRISVSDLPAGNYAVAARLTGLDGKSVFSQEHLLKLDAPPTIGIFSNQVLNEGGARFYSIRVQGNPEIYYDIEGSDDLTHWTNVTRMAGTQGLDNRTLWISRMDLFPWRFYRAVSRMP